MINAENIFVKQKAVFFTHKPLLLYTFNYKLLKSHLLLLLMHIDLLHCCLHSVHSFAITVHLSTTNLCNQILYMLYFIPIFLNLTCTILCLRLLSCMFFYIHFNEHCWMEPEI